MVAVRLLQTLMEPLQLSPVAADPSPLFRVPDAGEVLTLMFEPCAEIYLSQSYLLVHRQYVVTEQLVDVLKGFNTGTFTRLVLKGPEGVGKSVALVALAQLCQKPCIIYSPEGYTSAFLSYLEELSMKYDIGGGGSTHPATDESGEGRSSPPATKKIKRHISGDSKKRALNALLQLRKYSPIMLLDLSGISEEYVDRETFAHFIGASLCGDRFVVAQPNATMEFYEGPTSKLAAQFNVFRSIEFKPFTVSEGKIYLKTYANHLLGQWDKIQSLTNLNPLLLSHCIHHPISDIKVELLKVRRRRVTQLAKTLEAEAKYKWVRETIHTSLEMLYNAANSIPVPVSELENYRCCWLASEGIAYITDTPVCETFQAHVNFPGIVPLLTEMLKDYVHYTKERPMFPIVKGYYFEDALLVDLRVLSVNYNNSSERTPRSTELTIQVCTEQTQDPLTRIMSVGVLNRLRPEHPAIGAIGIVEDQSKKKWLLMMQVSLSGYKKHRSKVEHIYNYISGLEGEGGVTWLQYYQGLLPETLKEIDCIYVYVSPKQIGTTDPYKVMQEHGVKLQTKSPTLYFGVVGSNTVTDRHIATVLSQLD